MHLTKKRRSRKKKKSFEVSTKLQSSGFLWKGYRSSLLSLVIERALSFKTHVDSYQSLASTMSILQMKLQAKYHRKNTTTSIYTIKSTYLVVLSSGDQGHDSRHNNNIFILVKIFQCLKYFEYSLIERNVVKIRFSNENLTKSIQKDSRNVLTHKYLP